MLALATPGPCFRGDGRILRGSLLLAGREARAPVTLKRPVVFLSIAVMPAFLALPVWAGLCLDCEGVVRIFPVQVVGALMRGLFIGSKLLFRSSSGALEKYLSSPALDPKFQTFIKY